MANTQLLSTVVCRRGGGGGVGGMSRLSIVDVHGGRVSGPRSCLVGGWLVISGDGIDTRANIANLAFAVPTRTRTTTGTVRVVRLCVWRIATVGVRVGVSTLAGIVDGWHRLCVLVCVCVCHRSRAFTCA